MSTILGAARGRIQGGCQSSFTLGVPSTARIIDEENRSARNTFLFTGSKLGSDKKFRADLTRSAYFFAIWSPAGTTSAWMLLPQQIRDLRRSDELDGSAGQRRPDRPANEAALFPSLTRRIFHDQASRRRHQVRP